MKLTEDTRLLAGRYQIGKLIGRGGMADVHMGTDARLGRRVAIKLLKPSLATDPNFRLLFREEAQKAARMAHPTIVRVYDAGEETVTDANGIETQVPFIVMEYVDGRLLKDIIADGPLEPREAVRIVDGILTALEYSHRALVVHRDIKPGNVMITHSGQVKVMDFGIARAVSDNSATVADTSKVLGTAQYFSPEQAKGETVDARTDLYSTGIVLFEMLTGQPPFRGDRAAAVAYQHISEAPLPPSSLNPKVSPALDVVVLHALEKDKFERFQTAAEFREEVELAASGEVPTRKVPAASDFNATLFGVDPTAAAGSESAIRQLSAENTERAVRTQNRPPVAWIWAGIALLAAMLVALAIWVSNLPASTIGERISVQVADVIGQQYENGAQTLQDQGLTPSRFDVANDEVPRGEIIRTDPEPGTRVATAQVVKIYVSQGPASVSVPTLSNLGEDAARQALLDRGLVVGSTTTENSSTLPAGTVLRSSPEAGTVVQEGETIDLVVSSGLVTVPPVTGQPISEANSVLSALQLVVVARPDYNCSGLAVTGQSLPPGDHPQRSEITVTYCAG
ncbi:Stk1 family PASTA domain-containing Ser/Thr kinase [Salinibacterium sp. SYSU T00001]|uniref:Stk1 family PASTA domain-containing Ser/Thr kinase n=1 Tax=Homoserinimonas sedimenticola TaxID=2986805 RepID=UPI002236720C|nr:Stk1 family PASTA domain-containing Ser/Thr kinase [Salinibacterium sedimenticola]MCW4385823.1 Stk1 family PASTA domain-containing Ser/Thr kinase [Salinibacterium sedimenticola]